MTRYSYLLIKPLSSFDANDEIRYSLDFLKRCGYEGIELNLTPITTKRIARLERWLADSGLVIPSFCTGEAYAEGLCFNSPDRTVRRRAVARLIDYLDVARRFNAVLVVGLMLGRLVDESDPEVAQRRIIECLQKIGATGEGLGVDLVIEPVNHLQTGFYHTVADVCQLIEQLGSPVWKPMVDTIHMNIEEKSLTQPIYHCGKNVRHVHLCESNGGPFGTGHIDFAAVLRALENVDYDGYASVKVYRKATWQEAAQSSIEYLRWLPTPER